MNVLNGNNNNYLGGRKKKKGNGAVVLIAAVPVVLCLVMGAVLFSFTNDGSNPDIAGENLQENNGISSPVTVPDADNSQINQETPDAPSDAQTSAEGDQTPDTPSPIENPGIPDERPDSPEAPEIAENEKDDGLLKVDLNDWKLILVNPKTYLPEDFSVELAAYNDSQSVDARILDDLKAMVSAMKKEGLSPVICSSYRTMQKQITLYTRQVEREKARGLSEEEAKREAGTVVAVPGTSEHHTGLAVDIVALSYQILDENQENTAEQKWLLENCYDYGFILRYPNGKSDITGIIYEPWHYRYVGKEVAADIKARGITFEEWLDLYK